MITAEEFYEHQVESRRAPVKTAPTLELRDFEDYTEKNNCSIEQACDDLGVTLLDYQSIYNSEIELYKNYSPKLNDFEEYMDEHECSVIEACRYFGMTLSDYDKLSGEFDSNDEISEGLSRQLGGRAIYLLDALNEFSAYSKIKGFEQAVAGHADLKKRYGQDGISRIVSTEYQHWDDGKSSFMKAFGAAALINAGQDPEYIDAMSHKSMMDFVEKYIGPANKKRRNELRKQLQDQTSSIK